MMHQKTLFEKEAIETLNFIADTIEKADNLYEIELDLSNEILKLETTIGDYVINKHSAAQEIWLASPVSGPYHFKLIDRSWVNKNGIELFSLLSNELSNIIKIEFK
jgi:iron donor protein CyaY